MGVATMSRLFADGFRYKAWANQELLDFGKRQWNALPDDDAQFFVRILNHAHVVDRIFVGHITGRPHGFDADNTVDTQPRGARGIAGANGRLVGRLRGKRDASGTHPRDQLRV